MLFSDNFESDPTGTNWKLAFQSYTNASSDYNVVYDYDYTGAGGLIAADMKGELYVWNADGSIAKVWNAENPTWRAAMTGTELIPTIQNVVSGSFDGATAAKILGNTTSVCRKCYVHPAVIDAYLDGSMLENLKRRADDELREGVGELRPEEAAVLALLQQRLRREAEEQKQGAA